MRTVNDEDLDRVAEAPARFVDGRELTPDQVGAIVAELERWSAPQRTQAYHRGVRVGREQIRSVLRNLVGPATARAVVSAVSIPY